ncbi:glycosyltransferase [Desmospora profundinema]|uniref:Glycosyl transferase family 1 domain-containing protein n=1 Tax=Desmospora profundinema TaxID=1571184 RepID=A0ABU1IHQ4_9BACL|nr:glycosyltransferase [Desmospora profundinema]MDR6224303.1 hypothetical protein [Desmospora profundinema]
MNVWILPSGRSKGGVSLPLYPWIPRLESSVVLRSGMRYQYREGRWRGEDGGNIRWEGVECIHVAGERWEKSEWTLPSGIPIHQHLDRIPEEKPNWENVTSVSVPSKELEEQLRSLIPATTSIRLVLPTVPEVSHRWETAGRILRRALRERWGLQGKQVLGIVHGTISQMEWSGCKEVVEGLRRKGLKRLALCTFSHKTSQGEEAGRSWVAADWMLTGGGSNVSRTPLHFWAMARGIPVLTTDVGDHGEWVRHRHNGLLLTSSQWKQDLARYLYELCRDPAWWEDLGQNGRSLVHKWKVQP